jgi:hypothetical protein
VANYVDSQELGTEPVDCSDDVNVPTWSSVIRRESGSGNCQRSVLMSFSFPRMHPLRCDDECLFQDWSVSAGYWGSEPENAHQTVERSPAQLIADLFVWGGHGQGSPIGVPVTESPALRTQLIGARPNPANPSATITFSLAKQGNVSLKIFDVSGRLVRTLIEDAVEASAAPYEIVWDGTNNNGQHVGSGVFFYQLDAPGYTSSKKLVILK